ncbi:hypothetical protein JCM10449v2_002884 [Rhodotorula kratochvilovae]
MSTPQPSICTVCGGDTAKQCSKCRAIFFCSTRCQALLWPTHKVLCGRDPNVFYLPPLTPEELKKLGKIKDTQPYHQTAKSLVRLNLFAEEIRMTNVMSAYDYLYLTKVAELDVGGKDSKLAPWHVFAHAGRHLRDEYYEKVLQSGKSEVQEALDGRIGRGSFVVLNAFLRQQLVHATLIAQASGPSQRLSSAEMLKLCQMGQPDAIKVLDGTTMLEAAKDQLKAECFQAFCASGAARVALEKDAKEEEEEAEAKP